MAYTRLPLDERRRQVIAAGSALFADQAFEDITMRRIAQAAGISKALLYHYFPSKTELFIAAVRARAMELEGLLEPTGDFEPAAELTARLDAYLAWIEANAQAWSKFVRTAASVPEVHRLVEDFRAHTLARILSGLGDGGEPTPALRTALRGWLGGVDAAILDWIEHGGLSRRQLRDLLTAAFAAAVVAARQVESDGPAASATRRAGSVKAR
jgi:AcrR family transcriptional regulator